jgi:hypothetical protein
MTGSLRVNGSGEHWIMGGSVGVGTTSPAYKFHVVGADASFDGGSGAMRFYINRAGTNVGSIIFTTGGPGTSNGWAEIGQTDASGDLYFKANPSAGAFTNRMVIQGSSGNVGIGSISPSYKLDVAGDINLTGNLYFNSTTLQAARKYVSSANLSSAGYTVIGTVTGANYASGVRISLQGTADNTVINVVADILVNHSTDILISSQAGIYTTVTLRVKSDNNEIFSIEATTDSAFTCNTNVEIFPLGSETVTFGGSAQTGASSIHVCRPGINISATGGNDGNFAVSGLGYFGGSVGIGTYAPATELHVIGNGGWAELRLAGSTAGSGGSLEFYSGSVQLGDIYMGSSKDLTFRVNGASTAMYVSSSGNVGIGTTSPAEKLHVVGGNLIVSGVASPRVFAEGNTTTGFPGFNLSNTTQTYEIIVRGNQSNSFQIRNTTASTDLLTIISTGNVGIGTTSPAYLLDVAGTSRSDLHIFRSNQSAPTADAFIFRPADNTVALGTANTERLRINSSGNVGIGTTSPATKLQVNGTFASNALWTDASSIAYWGNYSTAYGGLTWDSGYALVFAAGGNALRLGANGTNTYMTINTSGNVGIGTTSPKQRLDINGVFGADSKSFTCTNSYTTGLTINLNAHTGVYVKVTLHGDLGGHSSIGYMGEFFIQNGDGGYSEPGMIIREVNNTSNATTLFSAQIVDPASSGTRNFELQFKQDSVTSSVGATLIYQIQGTYNSIS